MKSILIRIVIFSGILLCLSCTKDTAIPYGVIPDSRLPYIAQIRRVRFEANAIIYNPVTCKEIGSACEFFRTHAFAHERLLHQTLPPETYPLLQEDQADCWAAKHVKPNEVYAAVQLFLDDGRNPNIYITGEPARRAEKVRACAIEAGNWTEEE